MKSLGNIVLKVKLYFLIMIPSIVVGQSNFCPTRDEVLMNLGENFSCSTDPYILVFQDNFDGQEVNTMLWNYSPVGQGALSGTDSQELYLIENVTVSDGKCHIKIDNIPTEGRANWWYNDDYIMEDGISNLRHYDYTSGSLWSKRKFGYGIFEIRCKIPKGKGFWPSFWTFDGDLGWEEIDVFEFKNQTSPNIPDIWNSHFDLDKSVKSHIITIHNDFDQTDDHHEQCGYTYQGPDFSEDYHTFTAVYTDFKIEIYVDGQLKREITKFIDFESQQNVDCNSLTVPHLYKRNLSFPEHEMYIIFSAAVQSGNNAPDQNTPFPSYYDVDYVKYWKRVSCLGELNITNTTQIPNDPEIYNVILGTTVNIGDVEIGDNQQLTIIARDAINFLPESVLGVSDYVTLTIDPDICNGVNRLAGSATLDSDSIYKIDTNNEKVNIYPNPANDKIYLSLKSDILIGSFLEIYELSGRKVFSGEAKKLSTTVNVQDLSVGVYYLRVLNYEGGQFMSTKFIIAR